MNWSRASKAEWHEADTAGAGQPIRYTRQELWREATVNARLEYVDLLNINQKQRVNSQPERSIRFPFDLEPECNEMFQLWILGFPRI